MSYQPSKYSFGEEIAHAVSHGIGAALGLAGLAVLTVAAATRGGGSGHIVPCVIYGVAMWLITPDGVHTDEAQLGYLARCLEAADRLSTLEALGQG